jgi:hypothetical protein
MYKCPQNHASDAPDFCSVCGVEIPGQAEVKGVAAAAVHGERCPDCDMPRAGAAQVFCEVCGYNFQTGTTGIPNLAGKSSARPQPPAPPPSPAPPPAQVAPQIRWEVVVTVDASLYGKPNPDAPMQQPPRTFTLFETENLVGRGGTDIRAHVPIHNDNGVSRRHALLVRRPDGGLVLRDVGSANGTQLNGAELMAGVDTPVKDGDAIAIGAWTRMTVRASGV